MAGCRQRKGFNSCIACKLSRMLGHVKRKRKALATQQFDPLTSSPSSPAGSSPLFPFHIGPLKQPSKTAPSSCPIQLSTFLTSRKSYNSPFSAPFSPLHILPHPQKNDFHTHPSLQFPTNPSPLSVSLPPGRFQAKHSVHHTLWAVVLLALLCACLCICKEIAFVLATALHLILQPELGRAGLLSRGPNVNDVSSHHHEGFGDLEEKENMVVLKEHMCPANRRSTILRISSRFTHVTSLQWSKRSKSWTTLHSAMEGKMQSGKTGNSMNSTSAEQAAMTSPGRRGNIFALQVMVLVILGGLFHGRFLAICMVVCCILIHFKMNRLFFKKRLQV